MNHSPLCSQNRSTTRRNFIKTGLVATGTLGLSAVQYSRVWGANSRLGIASIGTGGKGWSDLLGVAASPSVQVIGLCNIDSSADHLGRAAEKFPQARQYADWRKLLDDAKDIQGVLVSTPDFMHAPISLAAMHLGKHVFCQKPLTHTVFEARQMQKAAQQQGLVTQMGNQIQSHAAYRTAVKIVHDGLIGKVREVHSWQGGATRWKRHFPRPVGSAPVPTTVRWDLWQGVAEERPYLTEVYHPFNWRGWQPYGTGQLGDFGCHILDPVFKSLQLTSPIKLTAQAPGMYRETWPDRTQVNYEFPATAYTTGTSLKLTWYDAEGAEPPRAGLPHIPADYKLPRAGSVLIGERGSLVIPHVDMPRLFSAEAGLLELPAEQTLEGVDHYVQWADACREQAQTTSHFAYAGPLTETVLLGTIGSRFAGEELQWDADQLAISNHPRAHEYLTKPYRPGWEPAWF